MEQTRLEGADFASATGSVHLVGSLTLNYDKVQLVADIDLGSLKGTGHLVLIEAAGGSQHSGNGGAGVNGSGLSAEDQDAGNHAGPGVAAAADDAQEMQSAANGKAKSGPKKKKATAKGTRS
jgi:hypothetical protein